MAALDPLICCICLQVAIQPVQPQHRNAADACGLVLCAECGREWRRSQRGAELECPRCKRCIVRVPTEPHAVLRGIIAGLRVRCESCGDVRTGREMHACCPVLTVETLRRTHGATPDDRCDAGGGVCSDGRACRWPRLVADQLRATGPVEPLLAYLGECVPNMRDPDDLVCIAKLAPGVVIPLWTAYIHTRAAPMDHWVALARHFRSDAAVRTGLWDLFLCSLRSGRDPLEGVWRDGDRRTLMECVGPCSVDWVNGVLRGDDDSGDAAAAKLRIAVGYVQKGYVSDAAVRWNGAVLARHPPLCADLVRWVRRWRTADRYRTLRDDVLRYWPRRLWDDDLRGASAAEMDLTVRRSVTEGGDRLWRGLARRLAPDRPADLSPAVFRSFLCVLFETLGADGRARIPRADALRLISDGGPAWPALACLAVPVNPPAAAPSIAAEDDPPWVGVGASVLAYVRRRGDACIRIRSGAATMVLLDDRYWDLGSAAPPAEREIVRTVRRDLAVQARTALRFDDPLRSLLRGCSGGSTVVPSGPPPPATAPPRRSRRIVAKPLS